MAKSIRSKHKRKMRNVKRQHYAKKEMESLKRIAKKADNELADLVTMKSAKDLKAMEVPEIQEDNDSKMDIDGSSKGVYDKRTKQDENGHYPKWMNQRAVNKHKKKLAKQNIGKKALKKIKW